MAPLYVAYHFDLKPLQPTLDILIAELAERGFECFEETSKGLSAYINKDAWDDNILEDIVIFSNPKFTIKWDVTEIKEENWNSRWERNFEPIVVGENCIVRAPFHIQPKVQYDIIIEPKMSFGTGHHETTYMMLQLILTLSCKNKSVLDMGCGTGVLAILTAMMGAKEVYAIDLDPWSYLNALENTIRNNQENIKVLEGDVRALPERTFDIILANINRNTLRTDIPIYADHMERDGLLILSGFYKEDLNMISKVSLVAGLTLERCLDKNDWIATVYRFL